MKPVSMGLMVGGCLVLCLLAQPGPPGGRGGGFPGFGDPARRTEMIVDRLAEDIGLSPSQWREMKNLFARAQTSAKPVQEELQSARKAIKEAVVAGKAPAELDQLHQQVGAAHAKLAAIQSAAFADALKLLKDEQKSDADIVYEVLGLVAGSGGRGPMPMRGAPGGRGPDPLGPGHPPPPGGPGEFGPPPKPPGGR